MKRLVFAMLLTSPLIAQIATTVNVSDAQTAAQSFAANASNLSSGTLPHARLPALLSGDIPANAANTSGTAGGLSADIPQSRVTNLVAALAGVVPSGAIVFLKTGSCPTGWTEETTLAGNYILATTSGAGNVGTSGGSSSYTPAGTNGTASFTPAGTNGTASFTPAGTNGTASFTPAGTNGTTTTGATSGGTPAGTVSALTTGADSSTTGGVAKAIAQTPTFTGSALSTHTHTVPAETFTGSAGTVPAETFTGSAGTVPAETFTGAAATITPLFYRMIPCSKN